MKQEKRSFYLSRLVFNLALSLAVVVFLFIVSEIVLRVAYHPENLGKIIRFDKTLGWLLEPDSYLHSVDFGRRLDYKIHINSLGMREREITINKPEGKKRILILGDSITFGTGLEVGERFSDVLNDRLGEETEVVNCAVCGWGNDQEYLYYESYARHLDPDIIILQLTINNDLLNNMIDHLYLATAPKPRFVLVEDSLILKDEHVKPPEVPYHIRIRKLLKKSRLFLFIKRRLFTRHYRDIERVDLQLNTRGFERRQMEEDYSYWSVYKKSYGRNLEEGWELTEAILIRFISRCREENVVPVIFAFPLQVEVDDGWRRRLFDRTQIDSTCLDFKKPYERLASLCAERNVAFVYPLEAFKRASKTQHLYFERDSHPNQTGHALAAKALLGALNNLN